MALEILETCIYAEDLDAAERFYGGVLRLPRISRVDGRHVFFRCGARVFLVFNPSATSAAGSTVPHGCHGAGHAAFAVREQEMPWWREQLEHAGVAIEHEVTWPRGGRSIYVRDPAGNSIELATPALWAIAGGEIFG